MAVVVGILELGLRSTRADVSTLVARLGRVAGVHELDRNTGFGGLVLDTALKSTESAALWSVRSIST